MCEHTQKDNIVYANFLPDIGEEEFRTIINNYQKNVELKTLLKDYFSQKISIYLLEYAKLTPNILIKQLQKPDIDKILDSIYHHMFITTPSNIKTATVTGGGLSINELTNCFKLKNSENIYVIGEAIDIHGPVGGYNISLAFIEAYSVYTQIKKNLA